MPNTLIWIPKRLVELGLVNVAARSPEAFIDYCEQDYAARVEHAAACVRESGAHVVMLTGPSASGKTTTAHKLADCIAAHGRRSAVVSLDNFYKDLKDYPRLPDGSVDYESVTHWISRPSTVVCWSSSARAEHRFRISISAESAAATALSPWRWGTVWWSSRASMR